MSPLCLCAQSCLTLWDSMDCRHQAPLAMGFSRQEYWSGLPSPSPGGLPDPGLEPGSLALRADSLPTEPPGNFHDKLSLSVSSVAQSCPTLCDSVNHSMPRVPYTARKSNQSILKETSPEYSLEGLTLKLKLQYFGHLTRRADSLEKTLMLGKIEGRRRRG